LVAGCEEEILGRFEDVCSKLVQRLLDTGVAKVAAIADPFAFGFTITAMIGICHVGDLDALGVALEDAEQGHFVALTAGRYGALVEVLTYLRVIKYWQPVYIRPASGRGR
jgi:hypothetical protein